MRRTSSPGVTRRAVLLAPLAVAGAAAVAGCTTDTGPPPPPDPDDLLRAEAAERERSLLREYDAILLVLPALAPRLAAVRAEHVEHLLALTGDASPSPSPSASPSPVPAVPPTKTAAAALAGLATAERAAAAAHGQGALVASRDLAALLASLSASEQSHPVVLA